MKHWGVFLKERPRSFWTPAALRWTEVKLKITALCLHHNYSAAAVRVQVINWPVSGPKWKIMFDKETPQVKPEPGRVSWRACAWNMQLAQLVYDSAVQVYVLETFSTLWSDKVYEQNYLWDESLFHFHSNCHSYGFISLYDAEFHSCCFLNGQS